MTPVDDDSAVIQRYGQCLECYEELKLTPKRHLVSAHRYDGGKCPGSGLLPVDNTVVWAVAPDGLGRVRRLAGTSTEVLSEPDVNVAVERSTRDRFRRPLLILAVLVSIPLVVLAAVDWADSSEGFPTAPSVAAGSTSSPPNTLSSAPARETTSQSNWPINQDGVDLSASGAPIAEPRSAPDPVSVGGDAGLATSLAEAGISDDAIRSLGALGMETGYLWRSRAPTVEEMQSFAYMSLLECQDVAAGTKTWTDSAAEAVASGAAVSDAQRMVSHLEHTFCP